MSNETWRDQFAVFRRERTEADPAWLGHLRQEAFDLFDAQGFPTTRQEEWRYTNLAALERVDLESGSGPAADSISNAEVETAARRAFADKTSTRLVFVDGHYREALSSPGSNAFESLASLRKREPAILEGRLGRLMNPKRHPFAALNTAFLDDGAVIRVPDGENLEHPIHLVFVASPGTPRAQHPRVLVEMGVGSRALVVQEHLSAGGDVALTNAVTEIDAKANSSLDFVLLQRETDATFHVSNTVASIERDARVTTHTVTFGGRLVRNDLLARIVGEGGECTLNGLFFADGKRLVDNHTQVDHRVPHGTSRELYKGILDGDSRGVFRGRVIVAPDAQKTDARQHNPNLLLGRGAEIDSRPQLEIHADDVKCSHGTSIGRLEEEALFYLRSRGIERGRATVLLTQGFANEILEILPLPGLAAQLTDELRARFEASESLS